jgi:hypothetical protein
MYVVRNHLPSNMAVNVQCTTLHKILTVVHQKFTDLILKIPQYLKHNFAAAKLFE